uniref:Uncharacterized protein n=1 Tax=Anguilla anguilla TaxID=7936 RepID=A0A0E9SZ35_ANGAN
MLFLCFQITVGKLCKWPANSFC